MRRGDRLFEVIEILRRAKGPISAQSIGEELGVTKRTVYRDVAALIGQGVPINGEAGVGYVLEPGFHMPPLILTPDEIEAVTLGMLWVQTRGEPELALAAEKLITKLEVVAPDKYRTSFLQPAVGVAPVAQPDEVLGAAAIRLAIRHRKKIALKYSDNSGQKTRRVIWPILLGYRDTSRIIAAWCEMREGFRYFRTERIIEAEVLEDSIPRRMDLLRVAWRNATDAERKRYEEGA
ncbi:helix-turn-helix transcriptional regulator [Ruegeria faecimaris]|uniref:helix-turn-helix transcriptional regulator n=1 Tax=Ruegeria faecimaris TaxID=686389 RepID=UPI00232B11CE|nr:YafY family protein [Ruegeria faecimaris]